MNNQMRKISRSSDKPSRLNSSKSREKASTKNNDYIKNKHASPMPSPRQQKPTSKHNSYIQFIATNKLTIDHPTTAEEVVLPKKPAQLTPKRNSPIPYFKGKKNKYPRSQSPSNLNFTQKTSFPKYQEIQPRRSFGKESSNTLQVEKVKKKKNAPKQKKSKPKNHKINKSSIESSEKAISKLQKDEQKLWEKLFKGIQFYRDLGRGAHALVRSAVDWNHKRKIAVKIYEKCALTEEQLSSIERQFEILNELKHPNIVALYELIQTYKTVNLVMEYGGGNSLDQYIKSKPNGYLDVSQAKVIFRQILEAVDYLHSKNITHRDIKTDNILLNKHLHLKIIDFGFSLFCTLFCKVGKNGTNTFINSYCGTPTYMAPEVVAKTPHNPQLSDRWSLGILLFNMLNGHCPFRAVTQKQLFVKIHKGYYETIVSLDEEAKDLIDRFLQKNPTNRISARQALKHNWMRNQ